MQHCIGGWELDDATNDSLYLKARQKSLQDASGSLTGHGLQSQAQAHELSLIPMPLETVRRIRDADLPHPLPRDCPPKAPRFPNAHPRLLPPAAAALDC